MTAWIRDAMFGLLNALNLKEARADRISLTNLAVAVCIIKVALSPQTSIVDLGALMLSVMNYAHKRAEASKAIQAQSKGSAEMEARVAALVQRQGSIETELNKIASTHASVEKIAEETRKLLNNTSLAAAFTPRKG